MQVALVGPTATLGLRTTFYARPDTCISAYQGERLISLYLGQVVEGVPAQTYQLTLAAPNLPIFAKLKTTGEVLSPAYKMEVIHEAREF